MKLFVTGTDTNVGKTIVASWLTYHLNADYWKPIQTGSEEERDSDVVRKLAGLSPCQIHPEAYCLKAPLSPHAAAALEKTQILLEKITLPETSHSLIVEGAGGVMVPVDDKFFMIDLMRSLSIPVIVVARSALGTINHTCLTLAALRQQAIPIAGVILNGPLNPANKHAIKHYGKVNVLAEIEFINPMNSKTIMDYTFPNHLRKQLMDLFQ